MTASTAERSVGPGHTVTALYAVRTRSGASGRLAAVTALS